MMNETNAIRSDLFPACWPTVQWQSPRTSLTLTDRKKIHPLRKLFGGAITKSQGIFAAAAQLRHTSLQVAVKHYTDPRQRAPLNQAGHLVIDNKGKVTYHLDQA